MSYNSYKRKLILKMPDDTILPMVEYTDSSVTTEHYNSLGRRYETHPKSWAICAFGQRGGLLVNPEDYTKDIDEFIEKQIEATRELCETYSWETLPTGDPMDWPVYYGDHFPRGCTYKAMKYFYSCSNAIYIDDYFAVRNRPLDIEFSVFNIHDFKNVWEKQYSIEGFDGFKELDNDVRSFMANKPKDRERCFKIGLDEFDDVKLSHYKPYWRGYKEKKMNPVFS